MDFDGGSDENDGLSAATAWKHAPGDAAATHGYVPVPGDVIALKRGVYYPHPIVTPSSGTEGARITYTGNTWGPGSRRAILDVGKVVQPRPMTSQEGLDYGVPNWADLMVVEDPSIGAEWNLDTVYMCLADDIGGLIMPSQYPKQAISPIHYNDPYQRSWIDNPEYEEDPITGERNRLRNAELAERAAGQDGCAILAMRIVNEQMHYVPVATTDGELVITARSISPSAMTGTNAVNLLHDRLSVTEPGLCAYIGDNKAIFFPRPGSTRVTLLQQLSPIRINHKHHIYIHGFEITGNMNADGIATLRENQNITSMGWKVRDTVFRDSYALKSYGGGGGRFTSMWFLKMQDTGISQVAGYRLAGMGFLNYSYCHSLTMKDFVVAKSGASCLVASSTTTSLTHGNISFSRFIISSNRGIHSNGITTYGGLNATPPNLPWGTVTITDFAEWNVARPLTAQGGTPLGNNGPISILRGWVDNLTPTLGSYGSNSSMFANNWGTTIEVTMDRLVAYTVGGVLEQVSQAALGVINGSNLHFIQSRGSNVTAPDHWINSILAKRSGPSGSLDSVVMAEAEARMIVRASRQVVYYEAGTDIEEGVIVDLDLRETVPDDPLGIDG